MPAKEQPTYEELLARVAELEQRLAASESMGAEHLRALLGNSPALVFLKDESGRYVYLNPAYEQRFVGSPDWLGKTDFDFWPRESAELFRAHDAEVLRSAQTHQYFEDSSDLDGERHCWLSTASKVGCRTLNGGEFGSRVRQLRSRGAAGGCLV